MLLWHCGAKLLRHTVTKVEKRNREVCSKAFKKDK
jgi:hypothetical protein